jgi:3-oxoacyl-[acyl-carrier protein] reductase
MNPDFAGRTALVTGAGRNIGRGIALAFAAAGSNVAVNVRSNVAQGEEVADLVRGHGVEAAVLVGDIGNSGDVQRMVDKTVDKIGTVDFFVNSAATRPRAAIVDITFEDWDRVIAQNLSGAFYFAKLVLPSMIDRGFGRVIFIGGPDATVGQTVHAHSTTAKAGILGLAKSIARAYGPQGITANVVVPGLTDTDHSHDFPVGWPPSKEHFENVLRLAVPRLGTIEEVADACLYLASSKGAFITGQTLNVNGGMVMQ